MLFSQRTVSDTNQEFKDIHLFCGKSAYQEALAHGYQGTEEQWLSTLRDLRFGTLASFKAGWDTDPTMKDPTLIYIDVEKSYIYRYDIEKDDYLPIGGVLGETADTAYRGDRGKIAYDHSQSDHDFVHRTKDSTIDGIKTFLNTIVGNIDTATKLHDKFAITIGDETKQVDGSEALTWTLDEIGVLNENDVRRMFSELIDGAPEVLDTFKEFADAINNDPNFATTISTALTNLDKKLADGLNRKLNLSGGTMTGIINAMDILPKVSSVHKLGLSTSIWKELHVSNPYIYGGNIKFTNGNTVTTISCPAYGLNFNLPSKGGTFSLDGHTHSYAGSSSVGGAATSANWLNVNATLTRGADGLSFFYINTGATSGWQNAVPVANSFFYILRMNHGNANGYAAELAVPLDTNNSMAYRILAGGNQFKAWTTLLDSANWSSYCAPASHSHSYLPLAGGTMSGRLVANGKISIPSSANSWVAGKTITNASIAITTATTQSSYHPIIACSNYAGHVWNLGALGNTFGFYGFLANRTENGTDWSTTWDISNGNMNCTGTITGQRVYSAVYNDYAEWYEKQDKDEPFEAGDILVWDETGVTKCKKMNDPRVIGVFSDTYGHIIGGESHIDMEKNHDRYVPVGLNGRVSVKIAGEAKPGYFVVTSGIPGVGMAIPPEYAKPGTIVGKILRPKNTSGIEKTKIQVMLG